MTWFGGSVVSFAASELVGAVITRDGRQKAIGAYSLPISSPLGIVAGGFGYVYVEFCFGVCKCDTKPPATDLPTTTARASTAAAPTTTAPATTKDSAPTTTATATATPTATPRPNITCPACFGSGTNGRSSIRFSLLALVIAFATIVIGAHSNVL